jgi:hypothetical protein
MAEKKPNWARRALLAVSGSETMPAFILLGIALADFVDGYRLEGTIAIAASSICMAIHRAGKHMFAASIAQLIAAFKATQHG